jgi:hypothetical protein
MRRKKIDEQYLSQGIYDQVADLESKEEDAEEFEVTVGENVPIDAGPQMATQLSVQRPPIEDDEFIPGSVQELARAAYAISEEVPTSQIEWWYKQLHKLLNDAENRESMPEEEKIEIEGEATVKEGTIKKVVRKALTALLLEQQYEGSDEDKNDMDDYRGSDIDYFGEAEPLQSEVPDALSLEDMALEFGYSGAPGIRQEINRLTDRMEYFATKVKREDLVALTDYAVGEYVDAMEAAELLEPEDIADLQKVPHAVKEMDSFRFFFVSAFILPAYKEVSKEAAKKIKTEIDDLGLPKEMHQTIFNQVVGATKSDPSYIQKKLAGLAKKDKIKHEDIEALGNKIRNSLAVLKTVAEPSDDLVQKSLDKWQSLGKSKKKTLLTQALEQTAGHQGS